LQHFRRYCLPSVFAKNAKDNLSKAEQAKLVELSKLLIARYEERP